MVMIEASLLKKERRELGLGLVVFLVLLPRVATARQNPWAGLVTNAASKQHEPSTTRGTDNNNNGSLFCRHSGSLLDQSEGEELRLALLLLYLMLISDADADAGGKEHSLTHALHRRQRGRVLHGKEKKRPRVLNRGSPSCVRRHPWGGKGPKTISQPQPQEGPTQLWVLLP